MSHDELAIAIVALVVWRFREQIQATPRRSRGDA